MYEFSLDQAVEKIPEAKTKLLMREVLSGYFNENYRSASVMLWTVVVCDVVFKMKELRDLYQDGIASQILLEIDALQKANQNDSAWEIVLIEKIADKTKLISAVELLELRNIQKHRHLSAHPILSEENILYRPTREMVLANIRNALEIILCKQAILSKSIFEELMLDLEANGALFPNPKDLSIYLNGKYYSRLDENVGFQIFKSLWRVTFGIAGERETKNRGVNYGALRILYASKRGPLKERAAKEKTYFSKILKISECPYYIYLIGDYVELYEAIDEPARMRMANELDNDLSCNFVAYFRSPSISAHIDSVFAKIIVFQNERKSIFVAEPHIRDLFRHAQSAGCEKKLLAAIVHLYGTSYNFDNADLIFDNYLNPVASHLSISDIEKLLPLIDGNSQIYSRRGAIASNRVIHKRAIQLNPAFDISAYPQFEI